MNNKLKNQELLKRIEKLEQVIQDIWASCSCLTKDLEGDTFNCEPPTCEECEQLDCICPEFSEIEEEKPTETEDIIDHD